MPIMQNVCAQIPADMSALKANLLEHLSSPVRWTDSIKALVDLGAESFVECGPGKVLSGLNKRIAKGSQLLNMQDSDTMKKVIEELAE